MGRLKGNRLIFTIEVFLEILTRARASTFGEVRLVGSGENRIVQIREAYEQAMDAGLDLVLVSDESTPPVVRIQDFKKIEYEKKKARKNQKKTHSAQLKEIRLMVNISEHDLETKKNRIIKFLERGDKVKVVVRLKGRERETPERAHELLARVGNSIDCKMTRVPGPMAIVILEPNKAKPSK